MIQIKGFAVKKSKIIVKIKNKILFFAQSYKKGVTGALVFDCRRTFSLLASDEQGNAKAFLWWNRAALDGSTFFLV